MALRVGLVGAGYIGRVHARDLVRDERVILVGVADVAAGAARRLAEEVGSRAYESLPALLDARLDALFVCTPNSRHVEPVLAGLEGGLHVFSEKPMATSLGDAWRLREVARRVRGVFQIGFNRRFAPVYRFVERLLVEGRLTPRVAHLKMNRGELQEPPWTGDPRVTGGYLYETPVHLFDMARYLLGEVAEVQGWARQSVYAEPDGFTLLVRFASGVTATCATVAHTSWLFPFERVELYGVHQAVVTEEMDSVAFSPGPRAQVEAIDCRHMPFEEKWGYLDEARRFVAAALGEAPPPVSAEDGYRATELCEAVYRAVGQDGPVRLPLPEPTSSCGGATAHPRRGHAPPAPPTGSSSA
jgi:myo-inositol 2-dehydrogenase/D-chiro-inositol 1-dehydrogenase